MAPCSEVSLPSRWGSWAELELRFCVYSHSFCTLWPLHIFLWLGSFPGKLDTADGAVPPAFCSEHWAALQPWRWGLSWPGPGSRDSVCVRPSWPFSAPCTAPHTTPSCHQHPGPQSCHGIFCQCNICWSFLWKPTARRRWDSNRTEFY